MFPFSTPFLTGAGVGQSPIPPKAPHMVAGFSCVALPCVDPHSICHSIPLLPTDIRVQDLGFHANGLLQECVFFALRRKSGVFKNACEEAGVFRALTPGQKLEWGQKTDRCMGDEGLFETSSYNISHYLTFDDCFVLQRDFTDDMDEGAPGGMAHEDLSWAQWCRFWMKSIPNMLKYALLTFVCRLRPRATFHVHHTSPRPHHLFCGNHPITY